MFFQPQSSGNFTIAFDGTSEEFGSTFPISLVNRVHPEQFGSTLSRCSSVMKQHMAKITESDKKLGYAVVGLVLSIILMISAPTLLVTVIIPVSDSDAWIPAVFIPILACIPIFIFIIWSSQRIKKIKEIHIECKKELESILNQENQMYFQVGVQWILRYDVETIGQTRLVGYKYLNLAPTLEILVNQSMPQLSSEQITKKPMSVMPVMYQGQAVYIQPTTQIQPTLDQPTSVAYQQANAYQKGNDNQPLLSNRV